MTARALVLIDGEHYAPVVRDALEALPYEVVGALLVGGTEKIRGGEDYGVADRLEPLPGESLGSQYKPLDSGGESH